MSDGAVRYVVRFVPDDRGHRWVEIVDREPPHPAASIIHRANSWETTATHLAFAMAEARDYIGEALDARGLRDPVMHPTFRPDQRARWGELHQALLAALEAWRADRVAGSAQAETDRPCRRRRSS